MSDYVSMEGKEIVATFVGPITVWQGDAMPSLDFVFVYDGGGYVDLSPAGDDATINVYISRYRGTANVQSGTATIVNAARGEARYDFSAALATPGLYEGQCKITWQGGEIQRSQKFLIHVLERTPES